MRLRLRVDTGSEDVESLREWLADSPAVRSGGGLRPVPADDPEHQGIDIDALSVAVGSAFSTASLVLQILNWRRTRPRQPVVTITQELPNGTVVRIDTFDPDAVAEAVRKLEDG